MISEITIKIAFADGSVGLSGGPSEAIATNLEIVPPESGVMQDTAAFPSPPPPADPTTSVEASTAEVPPPPGPADTALAPSIDQPLPLVPDVAAESALPPPSDGESEMAATEVPVDEPPAAAADGGRKRSKA